MNILPFICIVIYSLFALWLYIGINRVINSTPRPEVPSQNLFYSIIIAARNEEAVIGKTIDHLICQEYPKEQYEIIIVADRCSDRTVAIVKEKQMHFAKLTLLEEKKIPEGVSGKKNALGIGIESASSNHLILMDADCIPSKYYLATLNRYFANGDQVVLNIPKVICKKILLHDYLLPERLLTWSIAAAGIGNKTPFLAFGGSWGYTKALWNHVEGFKGISGSLSGDDDLLIYRMGKLKQTISVCLLEEGWVQTELPENLKAFFRQRRRHHSAGKFYALPIKMGYFLFHLSNLLLWIFAFIFISGMVTLIIKFIMDFFVLRFAAIVFKEKVNLKNLLLFELGYLIQHLLIAPLGLLGKVNWN